ncbi:MAG: flavin-dependent monooxygenase [Alphaproteobacteria bacterium]|nr:flavin-dependent monooxygenase [Alphaproteobacteria bacterium]
MSTAAIETPDTDAIAAAEALVPALQARAAETEASRSVPAENIAALRDAGLLRMGQPRRLGGGELPLDESVEAVSRLARGCASTAWVCGVYNDHAITIGMFDPRAADDIWGDNPDALVSAGFTPSGNVERADGGWQLSGTWGWSSGCDHADWLMVVALLPKPGGDGVEASFCLVPRADVTIDDNWHVMGLAGTGSKNLVIEDAFVPDHRTFSMVETNEDSAGRLKRNVPPLFCLPRTGSVPFMLAAPALGVAESLLALHIKTLGGRSMRTGAISELPTMQMHVAEAATEIDSARLLMLRDCREAMAAMRAGRELTVQERARGRRDQAYLVTLCRRAIDRLFTAAGANSIFLDNEMQRKFRDIHAIGGHVALNWDVAGTTYGRVAFGLDPATPLI